MSPCSLALCFYDVMGVMVVVILVVVKRGWVARETAKAKGARECAKARISRRKSKGKERRRFGWSVGGWVGWIDGLR